MKEVPMYKAIAIALNARENCIKSGNEEWQDKWEERLEGYGRLLPAGSGFDMGTTINLEKSTRDKIVLKSAFHKMDENGMYDGWVEFRVIIKPDFQFDFNLNFVGNFGKRQELKEYFYSEFEYHLSSTIGGRTKIRGGEKREIS